MKNITAIASIFLLLSSCNPELKKFREAVTGSDSVAVNYFKGDGTMDTVVAVKLIKDAATIEKIINYIAEEAAVKKAGCGVDGSIHFFKNDQVIQDVFFSRQNDCRQFSFNAEGEHVASELSAAADEFLQSLKAK